MYKSPAASSNLIHIMKSLWRLKSNGPPHTRNIPKHIPPLGIYCLHWRDLAPLECLWVKKLCRPTIWLASFGCQSESESGGTGIKVDAVAVERCREFLLCHSEEREIMSALSGLICLIWGQRLRPSVKVGQRGISAWRRAQKIFNLNSATQCHQKTSQGLGMDLRVCKKVAWH